MYHVSIHGELMVYSKVYAKWYKQCPVPWPKWREGRYQSLAKSCRTSGKNFPNQSQSRYVSPWLLGDLWHLCRCFQQKKSAVKTSLSKSRFRRMASIPNNSSFQLIELIESGRLSTHFAMAQAVFNWRRLRLAGSSKWQDDPSHQKTTATRQTHAKKWKQQISPFPFKSANLWQPPTLHLNISSLAGSLDLIGLKPSDNATIQGYLVIHLGKNSQPHR